MSLRVPPRPHAAGGVAATVVPVTPRTPATFMLSTIEEGINTVAPRSFVVS